MSAAQSKRTPPMQFDAGALLDDDKVRNGPMEFMWGQEEWIEPNRPMPLETRWPRRKLRHVLTRSRRWHVAMRIAPPEGTDLSEWGHAVAERLGVPFGDKEPEDRAVWLPMTTWGRNAGNALGSAGIVLQRLRGFQLGQAQVRVWRAQ